MNYNLCPGEQLPDVRERNQKASHTVKTGGLVLMIQTQMNSEHMAALYFPPPREGFGKVF